MFDAPLGHTAGRGFFRDGASGASLVDTLRAQLAPIVDDAAALESLSAHAARHFVECNRLLDEHAPTTGLACPIVDVRPRASACRFVDSLSALTSAVVHECEAPGDHWTMMFGENTRAIAEAVAPFLR